MENVNRIIEDIAYLQRKLAFLKNELQYSNIKNEIIAEAEKHGLEKSNDSWLSIEITNTKTQINVYSSHDSKTCNKRFYIKPYYEEGNWYSDAFMENKI